jgi:hypothetical protein
MFQRTMAHGQAILQCRKSPFVRGGNGALPPVWTPHKAWLSEGLDYVGRHIGRARPGKRRGETLSSEIVGGGLAIDGGQQEGEVVVSMVLGPGGADDEEYAENDGEGLDARMRRTWIDGETVICEVATGPSSKAMRKRLLEAWNQTWRKDTSVVVIIGRGWGEAEQAVPWPSPQANWAVLDHFRVSEFWMEMRPKIGDGGQMEAVGMVKLQRAELHKEAWWLAGREGAPAVLPMDHRRFWGDQFDQGKRIRCRSCNAPSPNIWRECWICLSRQCPNFWREGIQVGVDGRLQPVKIPEKLRFNADFLLARTIFDKNLKSSWELAPNLTGALTAWKTAKTVLGTTRMSLLWRGMICQNCRAIVPTTQWCRWDCVDEQCRKRAKDPFYFDFDMGKIPLQAIVPRSFVSWKGHPLIEARWAPELGGTGKMLPNGLIRDFP